MIYSTLPIPAKMDDDSYAADGLELGSRTGVSALFIPLSCRYDSACDKLVGDAFC